MGMKHPTGHAAGQYRQHFVFVGQFVDPENRDDLLQLGVALQDLLNVGCSPVVLLAEDVRLEDGRA